jgi:hypothetical protein
MSRSLLPSLGVALVTWSVVTPGGPLLAYFIGGALIGLGSSIDLDDAVAS